MTRPKSPNFTKTSTKALEREYLNEGEPSAGGLQDRFKMALMKRMNSQGGGLSAGAGEDKGAQNPSSTKSMTLAMQKRREQLEQKRKDEETKAQVDQDRFNKQNRVSLLHLPSGCGSNLFLINID